MHQNNMEQDDGERERRLKEMPFLGKSHGVSILSICQKDIILSHGKEFDYFLLCWWLLHIIHASIHDFLIELHVMGF